MDFDLYPPRDPCAVTASNYSTHVFPTPNAPKLPQERLTIKNTASNPTLPIFASIISSINFGENKISGAVGTGTLLPNSRSAEFNVRILPDNILLIVVGWECEKIISIIYYLRRTGIFDGHKFGKLADELEVTRELREYWKEFLRDVEMEKETG